MDWLWAALTVLGFLALLANLASLRQGVLLRRGVRVGLRMAFGAYLPRATVLLPVRGLDDGFDENVRALLAQEYPRYRLIVIPDRADDLAAGRVLALARERPQVPVELLVADASGMGGKVNALRTALAHLASEDEVVAFADADIRPGPDWLRQLVQPLADVTVGASTGFRWYVPPRPTFWSLVRSEWNAVSANVLFDGGRNYTWGGSSAIRVEHLPRLRLEERWREVLSDDLVVTEAVRAAGMRIAYAPASLVATVEDADRATSVEWCLRQMMMATLYLPIVRRYAAAAFAVFDGAVLLGLVSLVLAPFLGWAYLVPAILFLVTLPATVAKASLRRRAFLSASPSVARLWAISSARAALASLAVPWLMVWGLAKTRRQTVIRWRGRMYDVRDPRHVRLMETASVPAGSPGTSTAR
ncbi:MAG TPA: glycosyltransferase family 2 protein [Thermoplasmata archaeon]|nr:glycosyltransferase family 2 protein [Thermoplasmata archaeon]